MTTAVQAFLYRAITTTAIVDTWVGDGILEGVTLDERRAGAGSTARDYFSPSARLAARRMGEVYELLYCLENSVRELVERTLRESVGDRWWEDGVPETMRRKADSRRRDDERARWHGPRGQSPLNFVDFPELGNIIVDRWPDFEDLLGDRVWVENYFSEMNRSRRTLAHTGELSEHAVERMEHRVREWLMVVG